MSRKDHIVDITKISRVELEEMIGREQKLLANKSFVTQLPDNGSKIRKFFDKLCSELEKRCNIEETAHQLSNMKITTCEGLNSLEWDKKSVCDKKEQINPISENLDRSELQLIVNSKAINLEEHIQIINPYLSAITEQDLKEFQNQTVDNGLEVYSKNIITSESNKTIRDANQFKPFYTTKTDVHNPIKEKGRKRFTEEITSATPPALQHEKTVKLSLFDSIQLQIKQKENIQKIQQHNAVERMTRLNTILKNHGFNSNLPVQDDSCSKFFTKYRGSNSSDSEDSCTDGFNSDLEVHDEDDNQKGGVNVVVYS